MGPPPPPDGGLKVLHIVPRLFGRQGSYGGAERYALELAKTMSSLTPTRLVSFGPFAEKLRLDNLDVRVERQRWSVAGRAHDPVNLAFVRHCLWADVIHCHQFRSTFCAVATILGRIARKRVFVTDHGGGGSNLVRRLRIGRWINAQLSQSEFAARSMPYIGRRVEIIYAGVDHERYRPTTPKERGQVLYLGRLLPHKGVEHLIEAIPDGGSLKIVGRAMDADYTHFLRELAHGREVEFHTSASDEQVIDLLSSSQCLVLPSVYKDYKGRRQALPELVGLVLLEAMACGTAVVCTSAGGMPEVVRDGKTGFVVEPGSAEAMRSVITRFLSDPELAGTMGRNARDEVLGRFTWKGIAQKCLGLY